jgi:hypothetical protein
LVAGDILTWRIVLGGVLILIAIYLVELAPRGKSEAVNDLANPHQGV